MEAEKDAKEFEEFIDVEAYSKAGKEVPKGKKYLIRVDKAFYKVNAECATGKEILTLAGKEPFERFQLNQKVKGAISKIGYDETVCFTKPGIERFMTIPLDQTEG